MELVFVEQGAEAGVVFGVAGDDAFAGEGPVVFLANGDDLSRVASAKIVEGVVARDTGNAGDEQRELNRFLRIRNHEAIVRKARQCAEYPLNASQPEIVSSSLRFRRRVTCFAQIWERASGIVTCLGQGEHVDLLNFGVALPANLITG